MKPRTRRPGLMKITTKNKEERKRRIVGRRFSHGYHMVEGKQKHDMEDYVVAQVRKVDDKELGLYAIFDVHSGGHIADYLQSHLFDNILDEPDFWRKPEVAIRRAYMETDEEILEEVVGARRGGSTAVTATVINGEKLVVANVGDSRAVCARMAWPSNYQWTMIQTRNEIKWRNEEDL